jgi:hypothetical protein
VCEFKDGRAVVKFPADVVLAHVGTFQDELLAYLYFDYLRGLPAVNGHEVYLTLETLNGERAYQLFLSLENDVLTAVPFLAELVAEGVLPSIDLKPLPRAALVRIQQQTALFAAAYQLPVRRKLHSLRRSQLIALTQRFILFKSGTDPRLRKQLEPVPDPLSHEEARQFAADIIAAAEFYSLPLDFFLGIGAMENNYMDVRGDLKHTVWKRRGEKGDIVLKRRRGRVLVLNYSTGPWQITRETLRYAHRLYLKDRRDYNLLPGRLRPERELNLDSIEPGVLTTYAGLLFRDLLDRFDGDVGKAVGAYNGGIGNPNAKYEEGVRLCAEYARDVLEHAAALNGQAVAEMQFIAPPLSSPSSRRMGP